MRGNIIFPNEGEKIVQLVSHQTSGNDVIVLTNYGNLYKINGNKIIIFTPTFNQEVIGDGHGNE